MKEKIDYQVLNNREISREQMAEWLKKDIEGIYILLSEFLRGPEVFDALLDVYYKRYKDLHEAQKAQAELDLKSADHDAL